jgi:predicted DNA-binding protein (MmcQ/YjbR family)
VGGEVTARFSGAALVAIPVFSPSPVLARPRIRKSRAAGNANLEHFTEEALALYAPPAMPRASTKSSAPALSRKTAALKARLDAFPGAVAVPMHASRGTTPLVLIYKVMARTFAILSVRAEEFVVLKCDPSLVPMLRERYEGIGHRTHLDPRHWIAVALDSDVPARDVAKLARQSYDRVCAGLTARQKAQLAAVRR